MSIQVATGCPRLSVSDPCASWLPDCAINKWDDNDDKKGEKGKDNKDEDKPKS